MNEQILDDIETVCNMLRGMIMAHARSVQPEWFERIGRIDEWAYEQHEILDDANDGASGMPS